MMTRREAYQAVLLMVATMPGSKAGTPHKGDWHPWIRIDIPDSPMDNSDEPCGLGHPCTIQNGKVLDYDCAIEVRHGKKVVRISADELMQSLGAIKE
jgi:hypothetical protein